jgi:hypothetical protein
MTAALLAAALLAAPPAGAAAPRVVMLDLVNGTEMSEAQLEAISGAIVAGLAGAPIELLAAAELRQALLLQQSQIALGCQRESCLVDLAGVLEARYVIAGSLASIGGIVVLNLKLLDVSQGVKVAHRESHQARPEALIGLARVTAAKMRVALGGPPVSEAELAVLKAPKVPLLGLGLGIASSALAVYAGAVHLQARGIFEQAVADHAADPVSGPFLVDRGNRQVTVRNALLGGAAVAALAAALSWRQGW